VDIRLVVATNRRLSELVSLGVFRVDLYYRLSGVELRVPPLRTRREDIIELARYFLDRHRALRRLSLSSAAADALATYEWPGNVRELERMMESTLALAKGDRIELGDLPAPVRGQYVDVLQPSIQTGDSLRAWGGRYCRLVLHRCHYNKKAACRALGISYHTLQAYLRDTPAPTRQVDRDGGAAAWPAPCAPLSVHEHSDESAAARELPA
jgi:two-component system response regulator HydG